MEKNRVSEEASEKKLIQDAFVNEQLFNAQTLATEIELRSTALVRRCDSDNLKSMGDHQILERNKNLSFLDTELREIFNKFTAFSKVAALCGAKKDALLVEPGDHQDKALAARNSYAKELYTIITERDISEEKLKKLRCLDDRIGQI